MERHTKLVLNIALGRRNQATTDAFIDAFVNLIWPLLMLSFGPTWPLFRLPSQTQFLDPLP